MVGLREIIQSLWNIFSFLMEQITTIAEDLKPIEDNQVVIVEEIAKCLTTLESHSSVLSEHIPCQNNCSGEPAVNY